MTNHWVETAKKLQEAQKKLPSPKAPKISFEDRIKAIIQKQGKS